MEEAKRFSITLFYLFNAKDDYFSRINQKKQWVHADYYKRFINSIYKLNSISFQIVNDAFILFLATGDLLSPLPLVKVSRVHQVLVLVSVLVLVRCFSLTERLYDGPTDLCKKCQWDMFHVSSILWSINRRYGSPVDKT